MKYESESRRSGAESSRNLPVQRGASLEELGRTAGQRSPESGIMGPLADRTSVEQRGRDRQIMNFYTQGGVFSRRGSGETVPPTEIGARPELVRNVLAQGVSPELRIVDPEKNNSVLLVELGQDQMGSALFASAVQEGHPVADWRVSIDESGLMGRLTTKQRRDIIAGMVPAEDSKQDAARSTAKSTLMRVERALTRQDGEGKSIPPDLPLIHEGIKELLNVDSRLTMEQSRRLKGIGGEFSDDLKDAETMVVVRALDDVFNALTDGVPVAQPEWYNGEPNATQVRLRRYIVPQDADPKLSELTLRSLVPFIRSQTPEGIPQTLVVTGISDESLPKDVIGELIDICREQRIKLVLGGKKVVVGEGFVVSGQIATSEEAREFSENIIGKEPEIMRTTGSTTSLHQNRSTSTDGSTSKTYKGSAEFPETVGTSSSQHYADSTTFDEGVTVGYHAPERAPAGAMQELRDVEVVVFDPQKQVLGVFDYTGAFVRPLVPPAPPLPSPEALRQQYHGDPMSGQPQIQSGSRQALTPPQHPPRPDTQPRQLSAFQRAQEMRMNHGLSEARRIAKAQGLDRSDPDLWRELRNLNR